MFFDIVWREIVCFATAASSDKEERSVISQVGHWSIDTSSLL